jgi:hypothetical protein
MWFPVHGSGSPFRFDKDAFCLTRFHILLRDLGSTTGPPDSNTSSWQVEYNSSRQLGRMLLGGSRNYTLSGGCDGTKGLRLRFLITIKASLLYLTVPFSGAHLVPAPSIP